MADRLQYGSTQLANPNAPQTAFGDYSYGQSLARAADTVAQVSQVLKHKTQQRELVRFQLLNRQKIDELKDQDLNASQFMEEYQSFFETESSKFPELKEELTARLYYPTLDSPSFRNHVGQLEGKAIDDLFNSAKEQYSNEWIKNGSVTKDDLDAFHQTVDMMEFGSEEQKQRYEASLAEMEEIALLNAESMEEFNTMVDTLKFADRNPGRLQSIKNEVEREFARMSRGVGAKISGSLSDHLSKAQDNSSDQEMIDIQDVIEAGGDEEDIRKAMLGNIHIAVLKNVQHYSPEYFADMADENKMWDTMKAISKELGIEDPHALFSTKAEIRAFQEQAKQLHDQHPAIRIQKNPVVQKYLQEGNRFMALESALEFYGKPPWAQDENGKWKLSEGVNPNEYMGLDNTKITTNIIPPDMLRDFLERTDPTNADRNSYPAERAAIEEELGPKWAKAFDIAMAESLTRGLNGSEKNPRLSAYYSLSQFLTPIGQDMLYQGFRDLNGLPRIMSEQGLTTAQAEASIKTRLFQNGQFGMYKDAMSGFGTDTYWEAFEDIVTDMVYGQMAKGGSLSSAINAVDTAFRIKYYVVTPQGSRDPIPIPKDGTYILPEGPIDSLKNFAANVFKTDELKDNALFDDSFQKGKIEQTFDQLMANPYEMMPLFGIEAVQTPVSPADTVFAQDVVTVIGNTFRAMRSAGSRLHAAIDGKRPVTIYDPEKYHWAGAPDDSAQQMFRRTITGSELFFAKSNYRIEQAWGPRGEPGIRVYIMSKNIAGNNPDIEEAQYTVPLMDRKTNQPAFIPYRDLFGRDQ